MGSHAQRLVAAATALLLDGDFQGVGSDCQKPPEFSWQAHVARLSDAEFKQRYRLAPQSFDKLLSILEPDLSVQNEKQHLNSRHGDRPIELPVRLAVALRYFAGGDPLDLKLIYCISKTQVYRTIWQVVDSINGRLNNINFPIDDVEELKKLEAGFRAASRGGFWEGQVGAIDGVHFKMRCPSSKDVRDPVRYKVTRKDIYALLAMAICDADRRFLWVDISHASSTHDSTAWGATELGIRVERGDLPPPFFINGDSAFVLGPSMITPSNNDPELDDYDFYQSSNRMAIECAFGILIRRWGVLWRPLTQKFESRAPLIVALMHTSITSASTSASRQTSKPSSRRWTVGGWPCPSRGAHNGHLSLIMRGDLSTTWTPAGPQMMEHPPASSATRQVRRRSPGTGSPRQ